MALLEVKDLTAAYGGIQALRGVSLKVEEGQIVAVLGANGARKIHAAQVYLLRDEAHRRHD